MAHHVMEVNIETDLVTPDEPRGSFQIRISSGATVETLLRQLCYEAKTPCRKDYCLQFKDGNPFLRTDILEDIGIHDGSFLVWTGGDDVSNKASCHCNTFWFMAIIAFLIGTIGVVAICVIKFKDTGKITDFAIVFDAGSSHTSMFIYKWDGSKFNNTAVAVQSGALCKSKGGAISSFVTKPFEAGKSLEPCLDKAKASIPKDKHSSTPIYLGATAGMRLLRELQPMPTRAILESIRTTFGQYPFQFTQPKKMVRIITGEEEGTFSWISSNYATNAFNVLKRQPNSDKAVFPRLISPTIGAMDLGGASTQMSFIPAKDTDIPNNFSLTTDLFGHKYTLYSHSYLCYGVDEARRRVLAALIKDTNGNNIDHPCLPSGYNMTKTYHDIFGSPCVSGKEALLAHGSVIEPPVGFTKNDTYTFSGYSDPQVCSEYLSGFLFNFTAPCPYSRCSFNGVYQPVVNGPFYAFSSYYFVTSFLNMTSPKNDSFKHDQFEAVINNLCFKNWTEVKKLPGKEEYLAHYCEEANYIDILLTQGYGFTDEAWLDIHFVNKVLTTEIGWTLGFVLDHSIAYPSHHPEIPMYLVTFCLLMILFALFVLVAVGFAVHALKSKKRQTVKYSRLDTYGAI